jgi:hypothetical protein
VPPKRKTEFQIAWTTVSYRSVALVLLALFALAGIAFYVMFPQVQSRVDSTLRGMLERVGVSKNAGKDGVEAGAQQAHFTNIDGTVRVKKGNSNTWVNADYNLPLERGDVVQTNSEGIAKVVFADGTSYTVKQDSLIVIEEHSMNAGQQTNVAVEVTTGTVDLTTATYVQGSKSQVHMAGARASFSPETSAMVHSDPRSDQHQILVKKGSGEVDRKGEVLRLTEYETVTFKADSPKMAKSKEIGPPVLIAPANMMPIFVTSSATPVTFSWSPVPNVFTYRLRMSKNPFFSSLVLDKKVQATELKMAALPEGPYYWMVQSVDEKGRESVESEKNRFTVIAKEPEKVVLALEIEPFIQHGHVIEVKGRTEPNARVMVNGQEVPVIGTDGAFRYFTPPMPTGENVITITAQNVRGGVKTQQKKIVIQ